MAHAITQRKNGFNEMAYVGEKPWHGLGQELTVGATIEEWKVAAGMDWKVQRSRVRYAVGHDAKDMKVWDKHHVLMRSDSHAPLGLVSEDFKIVQPGEVLEFFRDLVGVAGFSLETAGTLHGGRKFWALASIKAEDRVVGQDLVKGRLMLATACDGTMRTVVKNVAERVVCANTLAIAMGERGAPEIQVSHRSRFDADAVKKQLGVAVDSFHRFIVDARRLAAREVNGAEANLFTANVLDEADVEEAAETKPFRAIMALFQGGGRGSHATGVRGTAWGLLNAVTEYVDHHARAQTASNRIDSAWFGRGAALKEQALVEALSMVE